MNKELESILERLHDLLDELEELAEDNEELSEKIGSAIDGLFDVCDILEE